MGEPWEEGRLSWGGLAGSLGVSFQNDLRWQHRFRGHGCSMAQVHSHGFWDPLGHEVPTKDFRVGQEALRSQSRISLVQQD